MNEYVLALIRSCFIDNITSNSVKKTDIFLSHSKRSPTETHAVSRISYHLRAKIENPPSDNRVRAQHVSL